jgi:hypothetical protein
MDDDPRETIRRLAALAGVPLSEERIAALAHSLPSVQAHLARLADLDYREAEPAGRPRLPAGNGLAQAAAAAVDGCCSSPCGSLLRQAAGPRRRSRRVQPAPPQ